MNDEFSYDKFHKNGDRIYSLYRTDYKTDDVEPNAGFWDTSIRAGITKTLSQNLPFLKLIEEKVPEIKHIIRSEYNGKVIKKEGKEIQEAVRYVDQPFFEVFSFNLLQGDAKTALDAPDKVVITEEVALKYFETVDVLGKNLRLSDKDFIISGIVEKPRNSSISLNILLPFESSDYFQNHEDNWGYSAAVGFIYLEEGVNVDQVKTKINDVYEERFSDRIKGQRLALKLSESNPVVEYDLAGIKDLYLDPSLRFGKSSAPLYSYMMMAVALVILLIACVNYVSLSVSSASARSLEVMVKKVVGASRRELRHQFQAESILLTLYALVVGYTLMQVLLPTFNELSGKTIELTNEIHRMVILFGLGLALFFGFVVGGYPAQILSGLKLSRALKGRSTYKIKPVMIRGMVLFQFSLCILFISLGLTMNRQFNYINDKDLGFDKDQLVYVENAWGITEKLKEQLANEPSVKMAFGAGGFLAAGGGITTLVSNNVEYRVSRVNIDHDFFETLGIEFVQGRTFNPDLSTEQEDATIVNETMYSIISQNPNFDYFTSKVIGVVKDFHFQPLSEEIPPMQFQLGDQRILSVLYVKLEANRIEKGLEAIEAAWDKVVPEKVVSVKFVDTYLANNYKDKKKWSKIINISSVTTVLIACIGLFGLTAINAMNRTKEIGIRKVMGASVASLLLLLNRQIFWLILLSLVITIPISTYIIQNWLEAFAYHVPMGYDLFALAGLVCLFVVILTIIYHSLKSSKVNPAELLRNE